MKKKSYTLKVLWGFAILTLVFSYPSQVIFNTPVFALTPFLFSGLIIFLRINSLILKEKNIENKIQLVSVDYFVVFFALYVVLYLMFSLFLDSLSLDLFMSLAISYVAPMMFYIAIRYDQSREILRTILYFIFISGLVLVVFLIYESVSKLVYGNILDFTQMAFEYRVDRMNTAIEEANSYQIKVDARSYGLLENHTVNAALIAISGFSALMYYHGQNIKKNLIFIFLVISVIISMSFTVIIGTFIAIFIVAIQAIFRKNVTLIRLAFLTSFLLILLILTNISDGENLLKGDNIFKIMTNFIGSQANQIFATGGKERSILDVYLLVFLDYFDHIRQNPFFLITGDGFSGAGIPKGGDFGLIETVARFGLFLSTFLMVSFVIIIRNCLALWRVYKNTNMEYLFSFLLFIPAVLIIVVISELHYGIYPYRNISSIIYIVLAVYANFRQNLYLR
jgi:hypothetical protein